MRDRERKRERECFHYVATIKSQLVQFSVQQEKYKIEIFKYMMGVKGETEKERRCHQQFFCHVISITFLVQ